jgi:hypothetical protein
MSKCTCGITSGRESWDFLVKAALRNDLQPHPTLSCPLGCQECQIYLDVETRLVKPHEDRPAQALGVFRDLGAAPQP